MFSFFELISIEKKTYENFVRTIEKRDEFFVWKRFYDLKSKSSLQTTISIDAETKIRFRKQKRTQFLNSFENETKFRSIAMTNHQQSLILIKNEIEFLNDQMKKKRLTQSSISIEKKAKFFRIIEKRSQLSILIENETKFFRFSKNEFSQLSISIESEIKLTIARTNDQQFLNKVEILNDSKKKNLMKSISFKILLFVVSRRQVMFSSIRFQIEKNSMIFQLTFETTATKTRKKSKKSKKSNDAFEFRIRKRTDFVVKKSCFFCVDEKKKKNVDNFSKFLMNNKKIFWFLILMKTFFFFWFLSWFFFSIFH